MNRIAMLALGAALLAAGSAQAQAQAQDKVMSDDVRCVITMTQLLKNPAYKEMAGVATFYFAGRIEGRDPAFDLTKAMHREIGNMSARDYSPEAKRCGEALAARNAALKAAGESLQPRGVGR